MTQSPREKPAAPVVTGTAGSNQERPQYNSPWPERNPAESRSEREVAKVLAILDELKLGGVRK